MSARQIEAGKQADDYGHLEDHSNILSDSGGKNLRIWQQAPEMPL
jgi:hypothetical protein